MKSFNRWWNRERAKLQSVYDKQGIKMGRKMAWLLRKRKNVVNNFMNQAVNCIIKYCLANRIGNIVIGELKEIKNGIDMGASITRTPSISHTDCSSESLSQNASITELTTSRSMRHILPRPVQSAEI